MLHPISHEEREHVESMFLFLGGSKAKMLENAIFQFVINHFTCKGSNKKLCIIISMCCFFYLPLQTIMQIDNKLTNIILALIAVALLAVCVASVMNAI